MANNIRIYNWSRTCDYKKVNFLYVLKNNVWIDFEYAGNGYRIQIDKGAMTDGLSIPKIFRWYLPVWDDKNILYNIAGICHDGAYGSELLAKPLADELFYKGLVMAGIPEYKAKTARWAVENLAGLHYGRKYDDYDIAPYVSIKPI